MIVNNSISAPQIKRGKGLFTEWLETHSGTLEDFYLFLTTPSAERNEFLEGRKESLDLHDSSLVHTVEGPMAIPGELL